MAVNPILESLVPFRSATVTNVAEAVKATQGHIFKITAKNYDGTDSYLQIYNVPAASVTVGTTVPLYTVVIPASGSVIDDHLHGLWCKAGISVAASKNADGSGAALGTAALVCIIYNA